MWSKGAVVVVKRGDKAMADAIEKGLDIRYTNNDRYDLVKNRDRLYWQAKIDEAQLYYGTNPAPPPKWARKIVAGFAFIVYGFSVFVDKYLKIH